MSDESGGLGIVFSLVFVLGLSMAVVGVKNCDQEERCRSLKAQGVPAYVSKGFVSKKCEVVGREMRDE